MRRQAKPNAAEECWALVGERRGRIWCGRAVRYRSGEPARVEADGAWALAREERRGDVIGFLHTHPMGGAAPSARDVRTMRAWCDAFGKPLLCLIRTPGELAAYRFDDHRCAGVRLLEIERFARGLFVGVDDGREVSSRGDLPGTGTDGQARRAAGRPVRRRRAGLAPGG